MSLEYKLWTRPDGTVEPIILLGSRGDIHKCITQGNGVVRLRGDEYRSLPDGDKTYSETIHLEHLQTLINNHWDKEDISKEWGRLRGEDRIISHAEVLEHINKKIEKTGYVASFQEGKRDKFSFGAVLYKKMVRIDEELETKILKSQLIGLNADEFKRELFEFMGKTGVLRTPGYTSMNVIGINESDELVHSTRITLPILCTEIGLRNYLEDMDWLLEFEVKS